MGRSVGAHRRKSGGVTRVLCVVAAALLEASCTSGRGGDEMPPALSDAGTGVQLVPQGGASGGRGEAGVMAPMPGGSGGTLGSMLGRPSISGDAPPCEVEELLETACQGCHTREPGALAPMALVTRKDFEAPAVNNPSRSVAELAALRLRDEQRPMPPPTSRRLTAEELALLEGYLANPDDGSACAAEPDAGVGPIEDLGECYTFQAHERAEPGDTTPFQAPTGEHYACFWFAAPWPDGAQAVSLRSLDTAITHHWQLYRTAESFVDGAIARNQPNCGAANRSVLGVYSHTESREQRMPEGVGLLLPPPGEGLLLEVHYYNPDETALDSAGVEVCTAAQPRTNGADVTALGPALFELPAGQRTTVESSCTPGYEGSIHVFRSYPHMHAHGIAMDSVIARASGAEEPLFDVSYDFNNQRMLETPAMLQKGDRVLMRCHYQNDSDKLVTAGFNSDDEMCTLFVYAWPAGALSSGLLNVLPGTCPW